MARTNDAGSTLIVGDVPGASASLDERLDEQNERAPVSAGECASRDVGGGVRALVVMSGAPALLAGMAATATWSTVRALGRRRRPPALGVLGVVGLVGYLAWIRPWTRSWGATRKETGEPLPGDELVADPGISMTRAVTIDAPVDEVWPWLAQIGQDRGGFYSYTWLENLAGCRMHNAERVHPEWQERSVGERVPLHPLNALALARFDRNASYAFEGGWHFNVRGVDRNRTRLIARTRVPRGLPSVAYAIFVEGPHFVMEREMLLGIKVRAERKRAAPVARRSRTHDLGR